MKRTIYHLLIAFLLTGFSADSALAQSPKFVNEFLNIGVGARAHGMFGSVVADVTGPTATYWNPAGLSLMDSPFEVSAMHAEWFGSVANYDYIGIAKRLDPESKSYGAISIIRMGIDNIPNTLNLIGPDGSVDFDNVTTFSAADYAILLSYSRKLGNNGLTIGGNTKVIRRVIGSFGSAWGFGFDLGAMWTKEKFSFGIMARDITSTFNAWSFSLSESDKAVFLQTGNELPVSSTEIALPRVILGGAYKGGGLKWSYLVQANLNISTDGTEAGVFSSNRFNIDPTLGAELGFSKKVFIRAGIGNIQSILNEASATEKSLEFQPNIGLGLNLGRVKIDYALTNVAEVAGSLTSHIVSLNLRFNERQVAVINPDLEN